MGETNQTNGHQRKSHHKINWRSGFRRTGFIGLIVGLILFVCGAVAGVIIASYYFTELPDRAKFLTENFLSLSILLAIIGQACIYFSQRNLMKNQWQAMIRGLADTRKAVRYSEAAYVSIKDGGVTVFEVGKPVEIGITFINGGNTPAYEVYIYSEISVLHKPPDKAERRKQRPVAGESRTIISPHGGVIHHVVDTEGVLNTEHQEAIKNGNLRTYVWGTVTYRDIFKRKRWTRFFLVQQGTSSVLDGCAEGNEADGH